jgi:hypothetical protein
VLLLLLCFNLVFVPCFPPRLLFTHKAVCGGRRVSDTCIGYPLIRPGSRNRLVRRIPEKSKSFLPCFVFLPILLPVISHPALSRHFLTGASRCYVLDPSIGQRNLFLTHFVVLSAC